MTQTITYPLPGFPVDHLAEDGSRFQIRAMVPGDKTALLEFFRTVSDADRLYLKDDVSSEEVVTQWTEQMNYRRAIPLLAMDGERIIAEGVLHRRRPGSRQHIGEVRIVVDPAYRNKGVGRGVLHKLAGLADYEKIERLLFEIVSDVEEPARRAALMVGFVPIAVLPGHAKDAGGQAHDVVTLELNVPEQFPLLTNLY